MPDSCSQEISPDTAHITAVQRLFLQHQPVIRGYILSMVPDFSMADDILQETFLVVSRKAVTFELGTSFPAWVKTIARFKCLEALRANRHRFETLSEEVLETLSFQRQEFPGQTDSRIALLKTCIGELAPQARRAIELRYRNDHLPPEIASFMGCAVQSVNVTLSRARAFLRECVTRRMARDPG